MPCRNNHEEGDTRMRLLSESSAASNSSEGGKRRERERQMQILLLTKQKLELALELQRLQRGNVDNTTHQMSTAEACAAPPLARSSSLPILREPAPAVAPSEHDSRRCERFASDPLVALHLRETSGALANLSPLDVIAEWTTFEEAPCLGWDRLEEADDQCAAPTCSSIDVNLYESFWNSPSPPKRGPLLSSATKNSRRLFESEQGFDSFNNKPASLLHGPSMASTAATTPSQDVLSSSFIDLRAEDRAETTLASKRTQIPPALIAVMKRKGKHHLVQLLSTE